MKKSLFAIVFFLGCTYLCQSQDTIKWLDKNSFETALETEHKPSFIFIKDGEDEKMRDIEDGHDERFKEMQRRMFDFLKDSSLVSLLNDKFNCFRFDPTRDSITFRDSSYNKIEKRGRFSHEFVPALTGSDRNRLPAIVIRDKSFAFYEFKRRPSRLAEMKVILAAEELKMNYLKGHLPEGNRHLDENSRMLERAEKQVESEEASLEKLDKSIFSGRQEAKSLIKKLNYFLSDEYKKTDLQSFEKRK